LSNFYDVENEDDLSIGKEKSAHAYMRKTVWRRSKITTNNDGGLGSYVDAPRKPSCQSLMQGLERQGCSKITTNSDVSLGSYVDAPRKPNCRSLMQGLERQGLQRHLPSRSSVHAELRDGDSFFPVNLCYELFSLVLLKRPESPIYPCGWRGKE
jgi:hypothetical protein